MTFVIGSIQLTISRIQPETNGERLQREVEWRLLEEQIAAVHQEAYRMAELNAFGSRFR